MKKVLVVGASSSVGLQLIKLLLNDGSYEVEVFDLNNNFVKKKLTKYKNKIKINLDNIYDLPHIGSITEKSEPLLTIIDSDKDFKKLSQVKL